MFQEKLVLFEVKSLKEFIWTYLVVNIFFV